MRIGGIGQLDYFLDGQLSWRKKELTTLKLAIDSSKPRDRDVLTRSAVALLYAHWEGFVKEASTAYVQLVARQRLQFNQMSSEFVAMSVRSRISKAGLASGGREHIELVKFFRTGLAKNATISWKSAIRTRSNLNYEVLQDILVRLGFEYTGYAIKAKTVIDRLVSARNGIAHGAGLRIEYDDYVILHSETIALIESFRGQISTAASKRSYRSSKAV